MAEHLIFRFDDFTLDVATRRLLRGDEELPLEPKSFRLLQFLVENRDRVLDKEEIFREVWHGTNVTDNALTRSVAQIRKALGEDPKQPRYIATMPTIGYRFIGHVRLNEPVAETRLVKTEAVPARTGPSWKRLAGWGAIALLAIAAAAWAIWKRTPRPTPVVFAPSVPFTTFRGNEDAPSFSPDGSQVAFQWDGETQANEDIYVKAVGPNSVPIRLTTDSLPDRVPSWSPDGTTIAFLRIVAPNVGRLVLIPALGGPERALAQFPVWDDPVWSGMGSKPTWSADGKWLVVPELVGLHSALFRVSAETGEMVQITEPKDPDNDEFPAVSPDGRLLVFNRLPEFFPYGALYVVELNEQMKPVHEPRLIPTEGMQLDGAAWTPDGNELIAHTPNGLYRIPLHGGTVQIVPGTSSQVKSVDVARRGDRLVYSVVHGDSNVWRIDLQAKAPRPERLIASTFRDVFPQYSPDGTRVAFQSDRSENRSQVWVGDANGGESRQLTFVSSGQVGTARWSPDGRALVMDSNVSGRYQVYTMKAEGGAMNQLTNGSTVSYGASWSRDGKWVYFTSARTGRNEIWKMPAAGGDATQMTRNGGEFAMESQDGKTLFFTRSIGQGSGSIWRMPVGGDTEEQIADSVYRSNYAVSQRGIYYMTHPGADGTSHLRFYRFDDGSTANVLDMGRPEYGLDISPDGRYLAYAQLDDPASDLMLIQNFR